MISLKAYKMLSQALQAEILSEFGVYLELIRKKRQCYIELYALYDFYVEIYFDTNGDPFFLQAFNSEEELEPYLKLVDIDSIFETK